MSKIGFPGTVESEPTLVPGVIAVSTTNPEVFLKLVDQAAQQAPGSGSALAELNASLLQKLARDFRANLTALGVIEPPKIEVSKGTLGFVRPDQSGE